MASEKMNDLPGDQAACFWEHTSTAIDTSLLTFLSPTYIDDTLEHRTRNNRIMGNANGC